MQIKIKPSVFIHKKHKVAIKLECDEICKKLLENEINMYLYLKRHSKINIPNIKYIGTYDKYKYIGEKINNVLT